MIKFSVNIQLFDKWYIDIIEVAEALDCYLTYLYYIGFIDLLSQNFYAH